MIELNAAPFWILCGLGVAMLVPVSSPVLRKWSLAALNLAFLVVLLRSQALGVVAGIAVAYLLLQAVDRPRWRVLFGSLTAFALLGLFVLHKRRDLIDLLGAAIVGRTLAVIGFSYVALRMVEVLRAVFERRHPAPDFPSTISYLLPFHMLAAGPIQSYDEFVQHQPVEPRSLTATGVLTGAERITRGLVKKFVLAYILQKLFLTDFQARGPYFLLELQIFLLWLYLDFSAYSDIAVGVGGLLGIATPENFNRPLIARNVIEFWERWHISLAQFIRRNLFVPLQMTFMRQTDGRSPLLAATVAIAISFVLCGLWHGLTIGFLLWGAGQAGGLITVRLYGSLLQKRLGTKGVRTYLANPWIRAAAVLLTFEFQAALQVTLFM